VTAGTTTLARRLDRLSESPTEEDLVYFLRDADEEVLDQLYARADTVRREQLGDAVHLRAILEISNTCRRGCLYCGINCHAQGLERYRVEVDEVIELSRGIYEKGYRTLVVQSGEDPYYTGELVEEMVRGIRLAAPDMAITLALGERDEATFARWFRAGADRYLLKHETSDEALYKQLNPGMDFGVRLDCLRTLKKLGYQTGSGVMIGLPGQTLSSLARDVLLFHDLGMDMIGAGPYIPVPGLPTPFSAARREDLTYRLLALNRLVCRDVHLPATTALSTLAEDQARLLALQRGANVVMPNETPPRYRQLYTIYPNKKRTEAAVATPFLQQLEASLATIGRQLSMERGDRKGY
jgi:biotin synthase